MAMDLPSDLTPPLSIAQAARAAGICRTNVYREIREGRLRARRCGGRTLIFVSDFKTWLESLPSAARSDHAPAPGHLREAPPEAA